MALRASGLQLSSYLLAGETGYFHSPAARAVAWVVGIFLVLGTAWGASVVSDSIKRKKRAREAAEAKRRRTVFDEICSAQQLTPQEKRQLLDGAAILELQSPSLLFVDSGLLRKLASSDREDAGEFQNLALRLFPSGTNPAEIESTEPVGISATA